MEPEMLQPEVGISAQQSPEMGMEENVTDMNSDEAAASLAFSTQLLEKLMPVAPEEEMIDDAMMENEEMETEDEIEDEEDEDIDEEEENDDEMLNSKLEELKKELQKEFKKEFDSIRKDIKDAINE